MKKTVLIPKRITYIVKTVERKNENKENYYDFIYSFSDKVGNMTNKAIKYRVYPTTEQSVMFAKTFGCCRKVYNLMLSDKIESYKSTGKFVTVTPAKYKKEV